MTDFEPTIEPVFGPQAEEGEPQEAQKPRFAIMGEFSAGKSTLSNLLIGTPVLPVKVTATQLPPVWISYGDADPYLIKVDGSEEPFDFGDLSDLSLEETLCLRVFHKSDALELCDLIDMPGISDPNMSSEVWERAMPLADGVIWCTHATQAWRQSEAAVWNSVDAGLYQKSLLLLTRIDKITSDRDRKRVLRRVEKEVAGLFCGVIPISLTDAIDAGDDHARWQQSGAEAFAVAMIELIENLAKANGTAPLTASFDAPRGFETAAAGQVAGPAENAPEPTTSEPDLDCAAANSILTKREPAKIECDDQARIVPQRIVRKAARSPRPQRPEPSETPSPIF